MALHRQLIMTAVFVSAPLIGHDNDSSLRGELMARYAEMKSAMASKDEAAIRSLLAEGFVSIDVSGKAEGASDMIKEVLSLQADPSRQSHTTIESLRRVADGAIVEQRYDMTKTARAIDGTEKSVALATLSKDNWIHDKGTWRIARTVTEQLDYTVDGVSVVHKVNPAPK